VNYRLLGRTGVQVSQLCFGTMSFGGDADETTSARMFRACRDIGINFFDTADQYNKGRSEEILGELRALMSRLAPLLENPAIRVPAR
jgi:aryl-alcohol dehydrogenase-like predicted oxidoreductase